MALAFDKCVGFPFCRVARPAPTILKYFTLDDCRSIMPQCIALVDWRRLGSECSSAADPLYAIYEAFGLRQVSSDSRSRWRQMPDHIRVVRRYKHDKWRIGFIAQPAGNFQSSCTGMRKSRNTLSIGRHRSAASATRMARAESHGDTSAMSRLFLDIRMPVHDDWKCPPVVQRNRSPLVVFVTAYDS